MFRPLVAAAMAAAIVATSGGFPAAASAGKHEGLSANRVLFVDSDAFPPGQTSPGKPDAVFSVISQTSEASRLEVALDGQRQSDRSFTAQGARGRTQFTVSPTVGWHELALTIVDSNGERSPTRKYSFGVRAGAAARSAGTSPIVGGRFTEADGSPAINIPVAVYPMLPMSGEGATIEQKPVATTVTAADGSWNVALSALPKAATDAAAANGGVLNLQAVADGVAHDPQSGELRQMTGVAAFATGLAIGGAMSPAATEAAASAVTTAPLLPVRRLNELPHSPDQAPPANVTNPKSTLTAEQAQHNRPVFFGEPDVTGKPADDTAFASRIGGSDYTKQAVSPATPADGAKLATIAAPTAVGDECPKENVLFIVRNSGTWGYTTALESHAQQDAWGGVDYSNTAGTSTTMGLSYNLGENWSAHGTYFVGNDFGISTGFTKGPYWSYQWQVAMSYGYYTVYDCKPDSNGIYRKIYKYNYTQAGGVVVPQGSYAGRYGANVSSYDGYYGWRDAPYKWKAQAGTYFNANTNSSNSYSAAVTVFGFSVTATTAKSSSRQQRYTAGNQSVGHYLFAYESPRPGMKVFYSY